MTMRFQGIDYTLADTWIHHNRRNNVDRLNGKRCVELVSTCGRYQIITDVETLERAGR
jgi:hypothetical protein